MERLSDKLLEYLESAMGRDVNLRDIRTYLKIEPGSKDDTNLRTQMSTTLVGKGVVKPSGRNDGVYKVIVPVNPVRWWDGGDDEPLGFSFPRCYEDNTEFGIEDCVEVFEGDLVLIDGVSNYGKTAIALSLLGENLGLFSNSRLMGSEYTAADGKITPKFKRRMGRMNWVDWMMDGKPRFELLPVGADYEDYIKPDALNVIDWISLPGEYYLIDRVMKAIKDRIGKGVGVIVLQKNRSALFGEGGERIERYADVRLVIDPFGKNESMLTLGKVKAPKGQATGRMWGFSIVDYGANLHNIREIVKCPTCYGKGWKKSGNTSIPCDECNKTGYIDK